MKAILQRVSSAEVKIDDRLYNKINHGLVILLGITHDDTIEDILWLSKKVCNLRVFSDENKLMNLSVKDVKGDILLISQFTLYASTKKGNRPSFTQAAKSNLSIPLYEETIKQIEIEIEKEIKTGIFGADMQVSLTNDGPVTIILDTKDKK